MTKKQAMPPKHAALKNVALAGATSRAKQKVREIGGNNMTKPRVIIEIRGGCAEIIECPRDIEVEILDFDNEPCCGRRHAGECVAYENNTVFPKTGE